MVEFAIAWISECNRWDRDTAIEESIKEFAATQKAANGKSWRDYFREIEPVRELSIVWDEALPRNEHRVALREFMDEHRPFFFQVTKGADGRQRKEINPAFAAALWPKMDDLLELWRKTRAKDWWAAGKTMQKVLAAADLTPPDWGKESSF